MGGGSPDNIITTRILRTEWIERSIRTRYGEAIIERVLSHPSGHFLWDIAFSSPVSPIRVNRRTGIATTVLENYPDYKQEVHRFYGWELLAILS
jgi:hypothetical protein